MTPPHKGRAEQTIPAVSPRPLQPLMRGATGDAFFIGPTGACQGHLAVIVYLTTPAEHGYYLENQRNMTPSQREMAIDSPHLVFFVYRRRSMSKARRRQIFADGGGKCVHCGCILDIGHFHVDHLVPIALGGGDDDGNLASSCQPCNLSKGAR